MTKARACAVHVTHEAREKMGGIGTVLEGLITSAPYQKLFSRNILVGPLVGHIEEPPDERLGHGGRVLYSSLDNIDTGSFHTVFDPIRKVYGVDIVYGTRILHNAGDSVEVEVESLLIDVFHAHRQRTDLFKARLHEVFGLQSDRFESDWGYEEWVRIAEPAFDAVVGLLGEPTIPHVMFGHEFMGIPALLKASMDASDRFRTVYYAHECPSARFVVESMPGHDVAFYNVLHHAEAPGHRRGDDLPCSARTHAACAGSTRSGLRWGHRGRRRSEARASIPLQRLRPQPCSRDLQRRSGADHLAGAAEHGTEDASADGEDDRRLRTRRDHDARRPSGGQQGDLARSGGVPRARAAVRGAEDPRRALSPHDRRRRSPSQRRRANARGVRVAAPPPAGIPRSGRTGDRAGPPGRAVQPGARADPDRAGQPVRLVAGARGAPPFRRTST